MIRFCLQAAHSSALTPRVRCSRHPAVGCLFKAVRGAADRSLLHWPFISFKVETKRSNLQKLIFMLCILLNPVLLIPPDSTLAIRPNVFFIGVLFNNTLIDDYHSIRTRDSQYFKRWKS